MNRFMTTLLFVAALLASCGKSVDQNALSSYFKSTDPGVQSGGIKIIQVETPVGKFNVWTKRFGNNPSMKVLLLHGGPGGTHEYFECIESFFPAEGIEFIYYDQLGSAYADQPADTSLWNVPRFVEEVEQVRIALGLKKDNFYLLGHSWGGILATEYALKYQGNLKALIISNMMSSCPDYDKYAEDVLSKQMDPAVLAAIKALELKNDFQNPKYMELLTEHFYTKHICRIPAAQWPDPVNRAFKNMNQQVYVMMQGPSEFGISGKLELWNRKADLQKITVPTLVIGSAFDTMDPEHMKWMSTQFENGSYLFCAKGSHMSMWDDQQTYMRGLIKFIKDINTGKKKSEL
ncbi:proline iminopeptidase-family hydrolase [bacterium]|nr:proline iminopeptidase-family hydrolase [bacterium]